MTQDLSTFSTRLGKENACQSSRMWRSADDERVAIKPGKFTRQPIEGMSAGKLMCCINFMHAVDDCGNTVVHGCMYEKYMLILQWRLTLLCCFILQQLLVATKENNFEVVELLLCLGANVASIDENGWTALHWAAATNGIESARVRSKS